MNTHLIVTYILIILCVCNAQELGNVTLHLSRLEFRHDCTGSFYLLILRILQAKATLTCLGLGC
jgi:hypothetical protein